MKKYDWVALGIVIFLIIIQFVLPTSMVDGQSISTFTEFLNYQAIHWSFNYFLFIVSILVVGLLYFLITSREKLRKYYWGVVFFWITGVVGLFVAMIKKEEFLATNSALGIVDSPIAGIVTVFLLIILLLIQVIGEYMLQVKKDGKNKLKDLFPFDVTDKYAIAHLIGFVFVVVISGILLGAMGGALAAVLYYVFFKYILPKLKK